MRWYLVHTKPEQEFFAKESLQRQGFECYLPTCVVERSQQGAVTVVDEPLFPRYIFIRLGSGGEAKNWGPIRSTRGVSRLVCFGTEHARVSEEVVSMLKARDSAISVPCSLFEVGKKVSVARRPFSGLQAVFQEMDGWRRVDFLSKSVSLAVDATGLRRLA